MRLAVVGFGHLGRTCAAAIRAQPEFTLAGVVRRAGSLGGRVPAPDAEVPMVAHISELERVDAALVCVPAAQATQVAGELMRHGVSVVECAELHGEAFHGHKLELDRIAVLRKVSAVVGAGWDPGVLSVFRELFALLAPKGRTQLTRHPGVSLHHTLLGSEVDGVRQALATETCTAGGRAQRYVYVELEPGAALDEISERIRRDPLFVDADTLVFAVDSVAELEQEGRGVVLERRGEAAVAAHQRLLLEARCSETALTAQVMLAAARALPGSGHRAYSLLDLPLGALWGGLREQAEMQWL